MSGGPVDRRAFLRVGLGAGGGLVVAFALPGLGARAAEALAGGAGGVGTAMLPVPARFRFGACVAVAVASGTPGIGNVTTGWPSSQETEVRPIAIRSSGNCAGRPVRSGGSGYCVPAIAAFHAPCGLAQRRIIRSSTVPGIGVALPSPGMSSAPMTSSFHV